MKSLLSVAAAVTVLIAPAPAGAAGAVWHVDDVPNTTNPDVSLSLNAIASSAHSSAAWAVGSLDSGPGATVENTAVVDRWDGHAWHTASAPTVSGAAQTELHQVAVSKNLWVLGDATFGASSTPQNDFASFFDGRSWHTHLFGRSFDVERLAAISPTNVWVLGSTAKRGLGAQWNGQRWTFVTLPADVVASGSSPTWAITSDPRTGAQGLIRWNGRAWLVAAAPKIQRPDPGEDTFIADVYDSGHGLTLIAGFFYPDDQGTPEPETALYTKNLSTKNLYMKNLYMKNAATTGWVRRLFLHGYSPSELAPDGSGGVWVLGQSGGSAPDSLLHVVGGKCVARVSAPTSSASGTGRLGLTSITLQPSTTTVFATATTDPADEDYADRVARYVP